MFVAIAAMRGRYNPDGSTSQRLEVQYSGLCNTITGVQKDNMVIELNPMEDGTCRTIKDQYGKNTTTNFDRGGTFGASGVIRVKQATKKGYIECIEGGLADLSFPNSKTRRGRVQDNGNTSPTLIAEEDCGGIFKLDDVKNYAIRKLTPRECWRLMGFADEDFEKAQAVNSQTQLYKQAGNSIVRNVLMAIFGQMFKDEYEINPCKNCGWANDHCHKECEDYNLLVKAGVIDEE